MQYCRWDIARRAGAIFAPLGVLAAFIAVAGAREGVADTATPGQAVTAHVSSVSAMCSRRGGHLLPHGWFTTGKDGALSPSFLSSSKETGLLLCVRQAVRH